jgi:long-chain acyl-CoA synthetase
MSERSERMGRRASASEPHADGVRGRSPLGDVTTIEPSALPWKSLPAALLERAANQPDDVALREKHLGRWRELTWRDYAERAAAVGLGLRALGVQRGDRVAIHGENRPEWVVADLAVQGIGAMSVGVYPTSPATEVEYLLSHSESVVLIAEDEEQLDKAIAVRDRCPNLRKIVVIDPRGVRVLDDAMVMTFDELEAIGRPDVDQFPDEVAQVGPDDVAIIVYTSGTTGPPKGAMLSHANLLAAGASTRASFGVGGRDEVLSYLPLCHIAERLISVINAVCSGYIVNFGEGRDTFLTDLRDVQPTFFLGVPRVWERMMAGVTIRIHDAGWLKRQAYKVWSRQGGRLARKQWHGKLGPFDRVVQFAGWLLLYRSLRDKLGMRRIRQALSGAAPIAPQVLEWLWSIGIPVREGYGMTENTALATLTPQDDIRIGKVGTAVPGAEIRISDDGEILTRGPGTFVGYFKDEAATRNTIDEDGWLHTGDVGELDADGFLTITDRMKDIIISAGGKNVSPSEIENRLKVSPFIREAIVVGDRRKYLTALIGIEGDTVVNWATRRQIGFTTYEDLSSKPETVALIDDWVQKVNRELASVEQIKYFRLLPKELDHEDGELTATQKVKRRAIEREFAGLIDSMYSEASVGAAR